MNTKVFNGFILVLFAALCAYIVLRGVLVPMTIDEAFTFINYIGPELWIPGEAKIDANNHFLNSFLAIISNKMFGNEPWSLRLPNMLGGIIYFFYSLKFARSMRSWKSSSAVFLGLIGSHFLIDFFGVCRGYGLSFAFLLISLYHLIRWWEKPEVPHLLLLLSGAVLAVFANLSMLVPCGVILGLTAFAVITRAIMTPKRGVFFNVAAILLFSLPMAFLASAAMDLKEEGLLYIGGAKGFWDSTVISLLTSTYGNFFDWVAPFIPLIVAIPTVLVLFRATKGGIGVFVQSQHIAFIVLSTTAIGQMCLHNWLGVNYPLERVALFYLPLTVVGITQVFDGSSDQAQKRLMLVPLIFVWIIPFASIGRINLTHVAQWKWEAGSKQHFSWLVQEVEKSGQQPTVAMHRLQSSSFSYYNLVNESPLLPPLTYSGVSDHADFILSKAKETESPEGYHVVSENTISETVLFQRNEKSIRTAVFERATDSISINKEYFSFYDGAIDSLKGKGLLIQGSCLLSSKAQPVKAWIVFEVLGDGGNKLYTHFRVADLMNSWKQETGQLDFHFICPSKIKGQRAKLYLWNIDKPVVELMNVNIKVLRLD